MYDQLGRIHRVCHGGAGSRDGDALLAVDFNDLLKNRFHQQWRDAQRRFVQQQHARLAHERATDGQHLLLAS